MANNTADEYYLQERNARKAESERVIALVRLQEKEKSENYLMRWEQDPEDRTLKRWVKVRPLTEREKKARARKLAKQQAL